MFSPRRLRNTVVVVEDDPAARDLYRTALTEDGFNVTSVEDGVAALQYLETHVPAAVVLDLGLPRLHGRDVLKEMNAHELTRGIPVVVVTGTTDYVEPPEVGTVLRKPVTGDTLAIAVHRAISSRLSKYSMP